MAPQGALGEMLPASFCTLRCASTAVDDPNALDWFAAVDIERGDLWPVGGRSANNKPLHWQRLTLRPPFVVENLLPLPIRLRWQCRASNSVLFEDEVPVGDKCAVCVAGNPHSFLANAPKKSGHDPDLPWERRGKGAQVLSMLLPGFKWSEDALIVQPFKGRRRPKHLRSLAASVSHDCAKFADAIDLFQKLLRVRSHGARTALLCALSLTNAPPPPPSPQVKISQQCVGQAVRLVLYVDVWLVNRTGLPLFVSDADGRLAASATELHTAAADLATLDDGGPRDWYMGGFAGDAPPLMVSLAKCRLRVANSQWSDDFLDLESTTLDGTLSLCESVASSSASDGGGRAAHGVLARQRSRRARALARAHGKTARVGSYELAVATQPLQSKRFWRTNQFVVSARYVLVNRSSEHLLVAQDGLPQSPVGVLRGEQAVWHWPLADGARRVRVTTAADGWRWSGAFELDRLGETILCLRATADEQRQLFLTVYAQLVNSQILLVVSSSDARRPRFRIDNDLPSDEVVRHLFSVHVGQRGLDKTFRPRSLAPGSSTPFAWDEPCGELELELRWADQRARIGFDELDRQQRLGSANVKVLVYADGPTKVARICVPSSHSAADAVAEARAAAESKSARSRQPSSASASVDGDDNEATDDAAGDGATAERASGHG